MTISPELSAIEGSDTLRPTHSIVARDPEQMARAQAQIIGWVLDKLNEARTETAEIEENLRLAKQHKWKSSGLSRMLAKAKDRVVYYEKIQTALKAGYYIVPNFPCDIFAVRVRGDEDGHDIPPRKNLQPSWSELEASRVDPQALPPGEGHYTNADANVAKEVEQSKDEQGRDRTETTFHATSLADVDFPLVCAKPTIMDATSKAMALKVFDSLGVLPARSGRNVGRVGGVSVTGDPMILGRISMKNRQTYGRPKTVSFLIAWWVDYEDL